MTTAKHYGHICLLSSELLGILSNAFLSKELKSEGSKGDRMAIKYLPIGRKRLPNHDPCQSNPREVEPIYISTLYALLWILSNSILSTQMGPCAPKPWYGGGGDELSRLPGAGWVFIVVIVFFFFFNHAYSVNLCFNWLNPQSLFISFFNYFTFSGSIMVISSLLNCDMKPWLFF